MILKDIVSAARHKARWLVRHVRRLAVIAIGSAVLVIGLVLVALPMIPGGSLGTVVGLTILSTELGWARRLRRKALARLARVAPGRLKPFVGSLNGARVLSADAPKAVRRAADVLRQGGLVAFPTETVYGLGAIARDRRAVRAVFEAKGRPADNPLIVHIADNEMLGSVADEVPEQAQRLISTFWPGPLTLVLLRSPGLPAAVSAGLDTVAVRMPAHPVALQLIRLAGRPVAAPSANRSGRPSPTAAEHVLADLGDVVDVILDAGPTQVGVESTVLDVTGSIPLLLRPGAVSIEEIERVIGRVDQYEHRAGPARSPGLNHRHYAPSCDVQLVAPHRLIESLNAAHVSGRRVGVLCRNLNAPDGPALAYFRQVPGDEAEYARLLFASFRAAEQADVEVLLVETVEDRGLGRAVMDRLERAARRDQPARAIEEVAL